MSIIDTLQSQITEYKTMRMTEEQYYQSMYQIALQSNSRDIINQVYVFNQGQCCDCSSGIEIGLREFKQIKCNDKVYLDNLLDKLIISQSYNPKLSQCIFCFGITWEEITNDIQDYLYPCEF